MKSLDFYADTNVCKAGKTIQGRKEQLEKLNKASLIIALLKDLEKQGAEIVFEGSGKSINVKDYREYGEFQITNNSRSFKELDKLLKDSKKAIEAEIARIQGVLDALEILE